MLAKVTTGPDMTSLILKLERHIEATPMGLADVARFSHAVARYFDPSPNVNRRAAAAALIESLPGDCESSKAAFQQALARFYENETRRPGVLQHPAESIRSWMRQQVLTSDDGPSHDDAVLQRSRRDDLPQTALNSKQFSGRDLSAPAAEMATRMTEWLKCFPDPLQRRLAIVVLNNIFERCTEQDELSKEIKDSVTAVNKEFDKAEGEENDFPIVLEDELAPASWKATSHLIEFLRGPTFDHYTEEVALQMGDPELLHTGLTEFFTSIAVRGATSKRALWHPSEKQMDEGCAVISKTAQQLILEVQSIARALAPRTQPESSPKKESRTRPPATEAGDLEIGKSLEMYLLGEKDALNTYIESALNKCRRFLTARIKDRDTVEDIATDIVFKVLRKAESDRSWLDPEKLAGYLFNACRNQFVNYQLKLKRRERTFSELDGKEGDSFADKLRARPASSDQQEVELLKKLRSSPSRNIQVLLYWLENDCDIPLTASEFGMKPDNVYLCNFRARAEIKELFAEANK